MTCAHVVYVSLKKVTGVDSVQVSLNEGLATVKLKQGNGVTAAQLWQTIHQQGYTPKATTLVVRGELVHVQDQVRLKVSGTNMVITLAFDPKNPAGYQEARKRAGQEVVVRGTMIPGKDFKTPVPLEVTEVRPAEARGTS